MTPLGLPPPTEEPICIQEEPGDYCFRTGKAIVRITKYICHNNIAYSAMTLASFYLKEIIC